MARTKPIPRPSLSSEEISARCRQTRLAAAAALAASTAAARAREPQQELKKAPKKKGRKRLTAPKKKKAQPSTHQQVVTVMSPHQGGTTTSRQADDIMQLANFDTCRSMFRHVDNEGLANVILNTTAELRRRLTGQPKPDHLTLRQWMTNGKISNILDLADREINNLPLPVIEDSSLVDTATVDVPLNMPPNRSTDDPTAPVVTSQTANTRSSDPGAGVQTVSSTKDHLSSAPPAKPKRKRNSMDDASETPRPGASLKRPRLGEAVAQPKTDIGSTFYSTPDPTLLPKQKLRLKLKTKSLNAKSDITEELAHNTSSHEQGKDVKNQSGCNYTLPSKISDIASQSPGIKIKLPETPYLAKEKAFVGRLLAKNPNIQVVEVHSAFNAQFANKDIGEGIQDKDKDNAFLPRPSRSLRSIEAEVNKLRPTSQNIPSSSGTGLGSVNDEVGNEGVGEAEQDEAPNNVPSASACKTRGPKYTPSESRFLSEQIIKNPAIETRDLLGLFNSKFAGKVIPDGQKAENGTPIPRPHRDMEYLASVVSRLRSRLRKEKKIPEKSCVTTATNTDSGTTSEPAGTLKKNGKQKMQILAVVTETS